jgi:hypothetical protein
MTARGSLDGPLAGTPARAVLLREAHLRHQPLVHVVERSSVDPRDLRSSPTGKDSSSCIAGAKA